MDALKMNLIYCYDAYCSWCYGFGSVMKKIEEKYINSLNVEVLSGGMILPDTPQHISVFADVIKAGYQKVEEYSHQKFGEDYLWHINNPQESDWFPNSLKPAIALAIIKNHAPEKSLEFAADLQYSLFFEGRDLTDDEAYRHLLSKYKIEPEEFYKNLKDKKIEDQARYDFALVKQLQVESYPTLLLQESESKFYLLAKGFTDLEQLDNRIKNTLYQINQ